MNSKFIIILFALLLASCATVFRGSQQPVTFNSEPEGASIIIEGNLMGKTPATLSLKRNRYNNAILKKEGYEAATVPLHTSYDAITLLNIFWDLSTTDLVTGNAYEYEPNMYSVQLVKKTNTPEKN